MLEEIGYGVRALIYYPVGGYIGCISTHMSRVEGIKVSSEDMKEVKKSGSRQEITLTKHELVACSVSDCIVREMRVISVWMARLEEEKKLEKASQSGAWVDLRSGPKGNKREYLG